MAFEPSILRRMEKPPRLQLDRAAWIQAALDTLADEGVTGVRVEVLAKRLHVTKGSFYWHFKDRQDLLSGILETWKDGRIRDIIKQTRPEAGGEEAQIFRVIDVYSTSRNRKGILIELAMREWARRDPAAALIVEEVDAWRLRCARELFLACGVPMHEASTRSMLLYAYVFGVSMMNCEKFDGDITRMKDDIRELIARSHTPLASPKP
jgi:AcrR family transcriptional regulator